VANPDPDHFRVVQIAVDLRDGEVAIPDKALKLLGVSVDDEVWVSPFNFQK
jgi:arginine/ornithine N-succinyltransferase beta subunit